MINVFNLFFTGIGPSSLHTIDPMRAAVRFAENLVHNNLLNKTGCLQNDRFGSPSLIERWHGSDKAVLPGLLGEQPGNTGPDATEAQFAVMQKQHRLEVLRTRALPAQSPQGFL